MRAILVGDMHVRPEDLEECSKLMEFIWEQASIQRADAIWFLGDQFNTHALIHADVLGFWYFWLKKAERPIYLLIGNHDYAPSGNHAMLAFKDMKPLVNVLDQISGIYGVITSPYAQRFDKYYDFFKLSKSFHTLITHTTIDGAVYDNGFYAKDGVKLADVKYFKNIISGHIHKKQTFGDETTTVHYLGSPRWLNLSDANQEKFIHLAEWDREGDNLMLEPIPTAGVCREIRQLEITPETQLALKEGVDYYFDLRGPKNWCDEQAPKYAQLGKVRTFPVLDKEVVVRESEGILMAFSKFKDKFTFTSSKEDVEKLLKDRIYE